MTPADHDRIWDDLRRPMPAWLPAAKLVIFIHWGPYSVPAWAEPSGALGAVPESEWFKHNAYAEWYFNTIRITGSPAAQHHHDVYHDAPYDDFLDQWTAAKFDPAAWAALFAEAGATYVVPTTKHHDGVALWDAPGTGTRNTVHRGPRRDLVGEIAEAVRAAGLRFGVYYSGGLDWSITDLPPITSHRDVLTLRPSDAAYNVYAELHVRDLIEHYQPDVLWNDINWPDAGKRTGAWSLHELLADFYAGNPDGVVNDRWGETHWDFRTTEYEAFSENESESAWENCPRDRLLLRLQPGRGRAADPERPAAGLPPDRCRVRRRAATAQRRPDRRRRDTRHPAGLAPLTRPLDGPGRRRNQSGAAGAANRRTTDGRSLGALAGDPRASGRGSRPGWRDHAELPARPGFGYGGRARRGVGFGGGFDRQLHRPGRRADRRAGSPYAPQTVTKP